ncbi:sulfite exporter TauE/SafE family protein [Bradyrhizobium sp. 180]|uniref:sulfite exporter TauE/SafE family protein n=1 Tax=unclassified Bradyrhizobium TaxID=2631580 RepID=UPI001FFAB967|nr:MULTISPECIES: sulfite exporter TauE/SafE family protein [unclassified Bradyrhizobium]MCK1425342.1 sulfite exporter TauE/SafE family protein [Bradyrhizobium sp. CW12]MCK1491764.1 sulfite exporter TauE/SafE family protein [Bradyrhizobium sp. 180]MCK1530376.1 sulfite exporter TauE/SafE family protein [Bradyrhizobium sp. 182]MCK1596694.1 sulfite exporter TauE/SafE family protein [Bradyrhizobium sp. 164]MCK1644235.1 sulfite exporter TauE/SafE family protein [Bradyrhizobium sp. 154]
MTWIYELLAGAGVGLVAGLASGFSGTSPGGGLVIFSVLLLGAEQHVAQGTSLIAQVPPTGLAGVRRYWQSGNRSPLQWIVWIGIGFLIGGASGSYAAAATPDTVLQWTYVIYLVALIAVLALRRDRKDGESKAGDPAELPWLPLLLVGVLAGFSSGFMGIGGGLAITVGLAAGLRVPQHQAQLVSLIFSVIPTNSPAAWIYWSKGLMVSWPAIIGILAGLWIGTDLGARIANGVSKSVLRRTMIALVALMALYMTYKALG